MRIACGYNPHFLDNSLSIPTGTELIELGLAAYNFLTTKSIDQSSFQNYKGSYSLHISRSPITENSKSQESYIESVLPKSLTLDNTVSIGFHLCGKREDNIGKYGFSSHYEYSNAAEKNAINFVRLVREKLSTAVWLENANFYSSSAAEIIDTQKSINRICKEAECYQIVDLAHLIIDCRNVGVNPSSVLGLIAWETVVEIHLSGIVEGRDGSLHDGHSRPVHPDCWTLLADANALGFLRQKTYINIEHSDSQWIESKNEFNEDFKTLEKLFETGNPLDSKKANRNSYAKSYLVKSLKRSVGNLDTICEVLNIDESQLVGGWLSEVDSKSINLSLTDLEIDNNKRKDTEYFVDNFANYVDRLQEQ